jgi:predicted ester cyclase
VSAEENKNLYRRWLDEIWTAGNYAVAPEILAEDLLDHTPMQGQPKGRAGDIWAATTIRTAFPDMRFEVVALVADDEFVSGRWTMRATHTGPFEMMGIEPTGRPVQMGGQEIFRVRDGRLAEVWHCEEVAGMLEQLKLGPPPRFVLKLSSRRSARQFRRGH